MTYVPLPDDIKSKLSYLALGLLKGFEYPIVGICEECNHDGCDEDGPESDLWDIHIVTQENGEYIYYNYHWENWFDGVRPWYDLYETTNFKNVKNQPFVKKLLFIDPQFAHMYL